MMGTGKEFEPRDWAYCGVFGAAAMLLPTLFHLLHLGSIFLPMYIPLFALAFVVRPYPCALTAATVPLLSSLLTGMPPLYPPTAPIMAAELAAATAVTSLTASRLTQRPPVLYLLPILLAGRGLNALLHYAAARVMDLPAEFLAGYSFFSAWPGMVLILLVVPAFARTSKTYRPLPPVEGERS
jgi:hypothetical protein